MAVMRTPEGQVKHDLRQYLDAMGIYYFMPVQTGYGKSSLDFLCCIRGRFVGIETKAEGKEPTARQRRVMKEIEDAGGIALWADDAENLINQIAALLAGIEAEHMYALT